jgi:hypothetical protein
MLWLIKLIKRIKIFLILIWKIKIKNKKLNDYQIK